MNIQKNFFELCAKNGIQSWDINKINRTTCTGIVNVKDIPKLRKVKRKTIHKVYFRDKNGFPFFYEAYLIPKTTTHWIYDCSVFYFFSFLTWSGESTSMD